MRGNPEIRCITATDGLRGTCRLPEGTTVAYGTVGICTTGLHTFREIEMQRTLSEAAASSPKGKCQNTTNLPEL